MEKYYLLLLFAVVSTGIFSQNLTVTSHYPAQNALAVPKDTIIAVKFNESVNPETLNENTFVVHGMYSGKLSGSYSYNAGDTTAVFSPSKGFKTGEEVAVTLARGIQNTAGNPLSTSYSWSFVAEVGGGSAVFRDKAVYHKGSRAYSVLSADFNRDTYIDVLWASYFDSISVVLGNGDDTFQEPITFYAGRLPRSLQSADFNNDGYPDLMFINVNEDKIFVLLGNGDGTFRNQVSYAAGNSIRMIYSADFNGDGYPDILNTNYLSKSISVLLGNGDGTFQDPLYCNVPDYPWSVYFSDFNRDGFFDIVMATITSEKSIYVLLGNGDGSFQNPIRYNLNMHCYLVHAAEFNGDGNPDAVVSHPRQEKISVVLGDGNGSFQSKHTYSIEDSATIIHTSDLNGDSYPDLAVLNRFSGNLSVLLGNGDGTFQDQAIYGIGNIPSFTHCADFNQDGMMDILSGNTQHNKNFSILYNRGPKAAISINKSRFIFDYLTAGSMDSIAFDIRNAATQETLEIENMYVSSELFNLSRNAATLSPDESMTVKLYFHSDTIGHFESLLHIESNDWQDQLIQLPIKGHAFIPLSADITDSSQISCFGLSDGKATITPMDGVPPFSYQWDGGDSPADSTATGLSSDACYHVTVTDSLGYEATDSVTLSEPYSAHICLVTVDTTLERNKIIWENQAGDDVLQYNIYRQGKTLGDYTLLGTRSVSEESIFIDSTSNPRQQSYKYKIASVDTCGNESVLSPYHRTILLSASPGNEAINLSWQPYERENGEINFVSYIIYRGTSTSGLSVLDTVASDNIKYNDTDPLALENTMYYRIAGIKRESCYPSRKSAHDEDYTLSLSNIMDNQIQTGGLDDHIAQSVDLKVYPNPFKQTIHIEYTLSNKKEVKIELYDVLGNKLATVLDKMQFAGNYHYSASPFIESAIQGIFYLKVTIDHEQHVKKMIKMN